jgi:hypothetical protein
VIEAPFHACCASAIRSSNNLKWWTIEVATCDLPILFKIGNWSYQDSPPPPFKRIFSFTMTNHKFGWYQMSYLQIPLWIWNRRLSGFGTFNTLFFFQGWHFYLAHNRSINDWCKKFKAAVTFASFLSLTVINFNC